MQLASKVSFRPTILAGACLSSTGCLMSFPKVPALFEEEAQDSASSSLLLLLGTNKWIGCQRHCLRTSPSNTTLIKTHPCNRNLHTINPVPPDFSTPHTATSTCVKQQTGLGSKRMKQEGRTTHTLHYEHDKVQKNDFIN